MPLDKTVPPAGEEIHLPGGSIQPLLVTLGITITLLGVTSSLVMVVAGLILTFTTIIKWSLDARRELHELPVHHHDEHHRA